MKETVFNGYDILRCVEDMNEEAFKEYNSIRVWVDGVEIDELLYLEIVVYNDESQ